MYGGCRLCPLYPLLVLLHGKRFGKVYESTVNSFIATTSRQRPLCKYPVLFVSQILFQKLSRKPLLEFLKRLRPLFSPEIRRILLFSISGKRPPNRITYYCHKNNGSNGTKVQFYQFFLNTADQAC